MEQGARVEQLNESEQNIKLKRDENSIIINYNYCQCRYGCGYFK
jgi:hypothetical protein